MKQLFITTNNKRNRNVSSDFSTEIDKSNGISQLIMRTCKCNYL